MRRLLLLLLPAIALGAPQESTRPGGIAVLDLGSIEQAKPSVRYQDKPVLVLDDGDRWLAVVGISLDTAIGIETVTVDDGRQLAFEVFPHQYREQRLTVSKSFVSPDPEQLNRIIAERKLIDAALNNWRDLPLEDIQLQTPVDGPRSSSFGLRRFFNDQPRSPHKGMDIAVPEGTPISSPLSGVVTATGDFFFNGQTVIVDHGQGLVSLYCHLSRIDVAEGDRVNTGDVLGAVGKTGRVTGAHLHFATYLSGTAIDPAILLPASR